MHTIYIFVYLYIQRCVNWTIPVIDGNNSTGSMEFTSNANGGADVNAYFPVRATFTSTQATISGLAVESVISEADGSEVEFSIENNIQVENYQVV